MYFNFCFLLFAWYSYENYEFCNRIKHLCNRSLRNGVLYVLAWVAWVVGGVGGMLVWVAC